MKKKIKNEVNISDRQKAHVLNLQEAYPNQQGKETTQLKKWAKHLNWQMSKVKAQRPMNTKMVSALS